MRKAKSRLHIVHTSHQRYHTVIIFLGFLLLSSCVALGGAGVQPPQVNSQVQAFENPAPSPTPLPTPKVYSIDEDIREVFGKDADKAFALLDCENGSHNPKAVNHNKDTVKSTDYGVFQVNDHWQGVSNTAFLTDPAINIRMAKNIYDRDGHTFKLWTCGRKLGL